MLWFDVKAGYRHFYMHPDMRDFFFFHYRGRYFKCIVLPFGWGRSPMWFTNIMRDFVWYMRERLSYLVLSYIDDFLVAPSQPVRASNERDVSAAHTRISRLMYRFGITQNVRKRCWEGSRQLDHLGVHIDSNKMRVYSADSKATRVQEMARKIIRQAQLNRRIIPTNTIRRFCGVCVSLYLTLSLARFYNYALYFDLSGTEKGFRSSRPSLHASSASLLQYGRKEARPYVPWSVAAQPSPSPRPRVVVRAYSGRRLCHSV